MAYEVACPTCHVRLSIRDGIQDAKLVCPRCLHEVAHPAASGVAAAAPVTRAVPSVEAESRHSTWTAYFIILALTVLTTLGVIIGVSGNQSGQRFDTPLPILFGLVIVLTLLILYPIGRGLFHSHGPRPGATPAHRAWGTVGVMALLVIIAPFAFFVAFFAVCSATLLGLSVR